MDADDFEGLTIERIDLAETASAKKAHADVQVERQRARGASTG
jgi:hypothetical protein